MLVPAFRNKKVHQLDDREWLKAERQVKTRKQMAAELSEDLGFKVHSGSIAWAEMRKYTPEERATFVYDRHHDKKSK